MGEVYVAEDTKLSRKVALKVLPPEMAENEERRARFEREAKTIAALNHPNIVTVYSVEESEGLHFITMELVRGKALSELLPKHGFSLNKFFEIAIPLADAMSVAHQEGITHRDLKPANVMVSDQGRVKVLDFGLAKPQPAPIPADSSRLPTEQMTQDGRILGTLSYMSPEQAEGKVVDTRSDLFSLGIIYYEMLTGCRPFQGDTPASVLSTILKDTPRSVTEVNPSVPRDLAKIVRRCLAKDAAKRFQSATDLQIELEELKQEAASGEILGTAGRRPTPSRERLGLKAAMVGLVLLAGILGYALRGGRDATREGANVRLTHAVQLTAAVGVEAYPSWSPDGRTLVYESNQSGNWDIWVSQLGGGPAVNRTVDHGGEDRFPSWSPDGSQIAFVSSREGGGYFVMSALGGPPRKVLSTRTLNQWGPPQWSKGGVELACLVREPPQHFAEILTLRTQESRRVSLPGRDPQRLDLAWSRDGRYFAYVDAFDTSAESTRLWVLRTRMARPFP